MQKTTFLHTADLHLGRAYKSIGGQTATVLAEARFQVLEKIQELVEKTSAAFVVIAGDTFDTAHPSGEVLAKAVQGIGKIKVPVYLIPGNHDPGGPLGPYESEKFKDLQQRYATNLHVFNDTAEVPLPDHKVTLLPCPIVGRPVNDPSAHLRDLDVYTQVPAEHARVVIAHGPALNFDSLLESAEVLHFERWPHDELDYVALGDWHGCMAFGSEKIYYAGTPEADRYPKKSDYENGVVLEVTVARGVEPSVVKHSVGRYHWNRLTKTIRTDEDIDQLDAELLQASEASGRVLKLKLAGSLPLASHANLNARLELLNDVYQHVEIDQREILVAPSDDEISELLTMNNDPTLSIVAHKLQGIIETEEGEHQQAIARRALCKLYEASMSV